MRNVLYESSAEWTWCADWATELIITATGHAEALAGRSTNDANRDVFANLFGELLACYVCTAEAFFRLGEVLALSLDDAVLMRLVPGVRATFLESADRVPFPVFTERFGRLLEARRIDYEGRSMFDLGEYPWTGSVQGVLAKKLAAVVSLDVEWPLVAATFIGMLLDALKAGPSQARKMRSSLAED